MWPAAHFMGRPLTVAPMMVVEAGGNFVARWEAAGLTSADRLYASPDWPSLLFGRSPDPPAPAGDVDK
jgi:hypothetical protein